MYLIIYSGISYDYVGRFRNVLVLNFEVVMYISLIIFSNNQILEQTGCFNSLCFNITGVCRKYVPFGCKRRERS